MHAVALRCRIGGESEGEALHLTLLGCVGPADSQFPLPSIDLASLCSAVQHCSRASPGPWLDSGPSRLSKSSVWDVPGPGSPSDLATCAKIRGPQQSTALNGLERCGLWLQLLTQEGDKQHRQLQPASGKACTPGTGRKLETRLLVNIGLASPSRRSAEARKSRYGYLRFLAMEVWVVLLFLHCYL